MCWLLREIAKFLAYWKPIHKSFSPVNVNQHIVDEENDEMPVLWNPFIKNIDTN